MPTDKLINPTTFLSAATVTVESLLNAGFFSIPDYQRDFSWTEEEITDLWKDLENTARAAFNSAGGIVSNPRPHFLGAIVIQAFDESSAQSPEIMDGQQRLVTLTVMFSVLVEFAHQIEDVTIRQNWVASLRQLVGAYESGELRPRIKLARDHAHYQALVCERYTRAERLQYIATQGTPSPKTILSRLSDCLELLYRKAEAYLEPYSGPTRDAKIIQLLRSICQLTLVLKMTVLEQGVAYEVFESLNARGLELQQADLLKNKLVSLGEAQGHKAQVVADWQRMQKAIEKQPLLDSLTEYLYFHFISTYKHIKHADLFNDVSSHLQSAGITATQYVKDAADRAEELQQILDAGSEYVSVVRDIQSIKTVFPNKYAVTLIVAAARRFGASDERTFRVIQLTHRFVFRRFLVEGAKLGEYSSEIADAARRLSSPQPSIPPLIQDPDALAAHLRGISSDAAFKEKFKTYVAPTAAVGFYVLEAIENKLTNQAGIVLQPQSPSQHLEHIMPKKPGPHWSHVAGEPLYVEHLNRIGNLLVLEAPINRRIKNKDFPFKNQNSTNEDYQHSKLALPKQAPQYLQNGLWNFQSISDRQNFLAEQYALGVWTM
jgi:hypothetical protein